MSGHAAEISRGERFPFGENWSRYLTDLTSTRITAATQSLRKLLEVNELTGKRFLDVGSGSGLFSLAARSLGASVHSFDYDPASVACAQELRSRYYGEDPLWVVEEGSVLDRNYLATLGTFDVVYSWGVLHHTGALRQALENLVPLVAPGGKLAIAVYNDQGWPSKMWTLVKRTYCGAPTALRYLIVALAFVRLWGPTMIKDLLRGTPGKTWRQYQHNHERGMTPWRDTLDWIGGYPFEVAKPEEVFRIYRRHGFHLVHLRTCGGGLGCNEFVFSRSDVTHSD